MHHAAQTTLQQSSETIIRSILDLAHGVLATVPTEGLPLRLGRIRGTGPGISFGALIDQLESTHPLELVYPFEGSDRVGGAIWDCAKILNDPSITAGIAKLRWKPHATDLPMHTHEYADRFIMVLEGRGFFHWSPQTAEAFGGPASAMGVETIAARSRDVFVFRRRLVHTFSTREHGMTLLSVQLPLIALNDPDQYRVPDHRWTADAQASAPSPRIACLLQAPEITMYL
jgi:hypothetical protein